MAVGQVRVRGLRELNAAFKHMSGGLEREMKDELRQVGEPVRAAAEMLAVTSIRNVGDDWSRMRLGVTSRLVYIAPRSHRRGGSPRPKFGTLLLEKAMFPALAQNETRVLAGVEHLVDKLGGEAGF